MTAATAAQAGVRALVVKGLVASHHGIREERVSADADVLVEPRRYGEYRAALEALGWRERPEPQTYEALLDHSATMVHDQWPCDIDVHWTFPGFLTSREDLFDVLWARRIAVTFAGSRAQAADRSTSILVATLHALRTPSQTTRHGREVRHLVESVIPALSSVEREDLLDLARDTGCIDTARPVLERLAIPIPASTPAGTDPALDAWRERVAGRGDVANQWRVHARSLPRKERSRLALRVLWPPEDELRQMYPEVAGTRRALLSARFARLGRGLRQMPDVLRGRRLARRGITDDSLLREGDDK